MGGSTVYRDVSLSSVNNVHLGDIYIGQKQTKTERERVPGTCEWLEQHDELHRWTEDDDKLHILWLLGAPGIGKTMISSLFIEKLQELEEDYTQPCTLAFYLCDNRNESRRTTLAILRGLLVQLLRRHPELFETIKSDYKQNGESISRDLSALFAALRRLLCRSKQKIFIVIDALDECERLSRHGFFAFLEDLDPDMNVSIVITSRPELDIEDAMGDTTEFIRVESVRVSNDLFRFIDIGVDELKKKRKSYPSKLIEDIQTALQKQAGGTFLWASLVLQDIASAKTANRAREKLSGLPQGLPNIYGRILENIGDEDADDAAFVLRWVVATRRPLTVGELATIQAMASEEWEGDSAPSPKTLEELANGYRVCGPLLYLDHKNATVNLVHQSAKDFLSALDCPERYRVDRDES